MSNHCLTAKSKRKIKKNDLFADEKTLAKTFIEFSVKVMLALVFITTVMF